MKGLDLNAGFVAWVGNIAPDDAIILKLLRNAGCVFYARTTQPQTLMHLETSNNIYGVTVRFEMSQMRSLAKWLPHGVWFN
jgi:Asp-tRNA(Asn)/Glu-tRNA(Gln) amidotransferase A subunit family amidase